MSIQSLLESKIREYDSTIDVSEGSLAQTRIIQPIVSALGTDPLSVNVREYLYAKIAETFPDTVIAKGSALEDLLINAAEVFLSGYRQELENLKTAMSLYNIDILSDDDADALASNWFVGRNTGSKSTATVDITVDRTSPLDINTVTTRFFSAGGIEFSPTADALISPDQILGGVTGVNRYTVSINVIAVVSGEDGNVPAGAIVRSTGIPNAVSVVNTSAATGGTTADTTEYLLATKLPRAISERSLITARGIGARISSDIVGVKRYQVIGLDDVEMLRDKVSVTSYSSVLLTGYTYFIGQYAFIFGTRYSGGSVLTGDTLKVINTNGSDSNYAVVQSTPVATSVLFGDDSATDLVEVTPHGPTNTLGVVTLVRPASAILNEQVVDGQISLGGKVDVYLRGERLQSAAGSALLTNATNDTIGTRWVTVDSKTIDLFSITPFTGSEISPFTFLVILGQIRAISKVTYLGQVVNEHKVQVSLFKDLPNDYIEGTLWKVCGDLRYITGTDFLQVLPIGAMTLEATSVIGSTHIKLSGTIVGLVLPSVGDFVEVESLNIFKRIVGVAPNHVVIVISPTQSTFGGRSARVVKRGTSLLSPAIEVKALDHPYKHPLSMDVSTIKSESASTLIGSGVMLLPLGEALKSLFDTTLAATLKKPTLFSNEIEDTSAKFYIYMDVNEAGKTLNKNAGLSRGYAQDKLGLATLLISDAGVTFANDRVTKPVHEISLFTDLFTSNSRNQMALLGSVGAHGVDLPYPGEGIRSGDILRIDQGPLRGSYIIESVLHNEIAYVGKDDGVDLSQRTSTISNIYGYGAEAQVGGAPFTYAQRVSIVRIYGEFPALPALTLSKHITIPTDTLETLADEVIMTINREWLSSYINGSHDILSATLSDDLKSDIIAAAAGHPMIPCAIDPQNVNELVAAMMATSEVSYRIIKPSKSTGAVSTLDDVEVSLARPSVTNMDIKDLVTALRAGELRSLSTLTHSEIQGSVGTYHLDPTTVYYSGGADSTKWDSLLTPKTINAFDTSNFILKDSYSPVLSAFYISGPSCVDKTYMREDIQLARHREISLVRSSLSRDIQEEFSENQVYIFGCPLMPALVDNDPVGVKLISGTTLGAAVYTTNISEHVSNDLLNSRLGDNTLISEVYAGWSAILVVSDDAIASVLRAHYGSMVVLWWQGLPGSDEFSLDMELPNKGLILGDTVYRSDAIAMGSVSVSTDRVEILRTSPIADEALPAVVGNMVRIDHAGSTYWRTAVSVQGRDINLDTSLPIATPPILNYGICAIDMSTGDIYQTAHNIFLSGTDGEALSGDAPDTLLHLGGSLNPITQSDLGRHITLWGYSATQRDNTSLVIAQETLSESASLEEFTQGLLSPERLTLGQYVIKDVETEYETSTALGFSTERSVKVSLGPSSPQDVTSSWIDHVTPTYLMCSFAITDVTADIPESGVSNVVEVTVLSTSLDTFPLVGRETLDETSYLVQGSTNVYSYADFIEAREVGDDFTASVLDAFYDRDLVSVTLQRTLPIFGGDRVIISSTNATSDVFDESMRVDGIGSGYEIVPNNPALSKSTSESIVITVTPTDEEVSDAVDVAGYFDSSVTQAQALLSSRDERAVCAEGLAKTLHSAYVGVTATYSGGPSEEDVVSHISTVLSNLILVEGAINESLIISSIMELGAQDVSTPVDLYLCYEDNSRRLHKRKINNYLTDGSLFASDMTLRTSYVGVPSPGETRLGASITLTRVQAGRDNIGTGGA